MANFKFNWGKKLTARWQVTVKLLTECVKSKGHLCYPVSQSLGGAKLVSEMPSQEFNFPKYTNWFMKCLGNPAHDLKNLISDLSK